MRCVLHWPVLAVGTGVQVDLLVLLLVLAQRLLADRGRFARLRAKTCGAGRGMLPRPMVADAAPAAVVAPAARSVVALEVSRCFPIAQP